MSGWYGPPTQSAPRPRGSRVSSRSILGLLIGGLVGLAILGAFVVLTSQPAPPEPPCQPGVPCGGPPVVQVSPLPVASPTPALTPAPVASPTPVTSPQPTPVSSAPPLVTGSLWQSATLGYAFVYSPDDWQLAESSDAIAVLDSYWFDARLWVIGADGATSPRELIDQTVASLDNSFLGRVANTRSYDGVLGPSIGYVRGEADVYSATIIGADGAPLAPVGLTVLASTDGRITVCVAVLVGNPDTRLTSETQQHLVRSSADGILKTFDWGAP
jgi:hypothetical protein